VTTETKVTTEISNLEPAIPFILLRGMAKSDLHRTLVLLMKIKNLYFYIFFVSMTVDYVSEYVF